MMATGIVVRSAVGRSRNALTSVSKWAQIRETSLLSSADRRRDKRFRLSQAPTEGDAVSLPPRPPADSSAAMTSPPDNTRIDNSALDEDEFDTQPLPTLTGWAPADGDHHTSTPTPRTSPCWRQRQRRRLRQAATCGTSSRTRGRLPAFGCGPHLALILIALLAGLRSEELRLADIGDIRTTDNRAATIHVRGKGGKERSVPIEAELLSVIEAYLDSRAIRFPGGTKDSRQNNLGHLRACRLDGVVPLAVPRVACAAAWCRRLWPSI